jgi:hypothetical protein
MDSDLKKAGLTRAERRRRKREVFKNGQFTKEAQIVLDASHERTTAEIIENAPFEPAELQALMTYVRGGSGRDIVSSAFHRILANPTWIMKRFAADPENLTGITGWLRQGGLKFVENIGKSLAIWQEGITVRKEQEVARLRLIETIQDPRIREVLQKDSSEREREQEKALSRLRKGLNQGILRKIAERPGASPELANLSIEELQKSCPGIACFVAAGLHATKRAMQEVQPRTLKVSDFGDAMHAFYAPYVDIYRTDAFMADGLEEILLQCGTTIAPRLHDLPALIGQILGSKPAPNENLT